MTRADLAQSLTILDRYNGYEEPVEVAGKALLVPGPPPGEMAPNDRSWLERHGWHWDELDFCWRCLL